MNKLKLEDYKKIHNNNKVNELITLVNRKITNIQGKTMEIHNRYKIIFSHAIKLYRYNSKTQKLEKLKYSKKVNRWVIGVISENKKIIILIKDEYNNYDKLIIKSMTKEIKFKFVK